MLKNRSASLVVFFFEWDFSGSSSTLVHHFLLWIRDGLVIVSFCQRKNMVVASFYKHTADDFLVFESFDVQGCVVVDDGGGFEFLNVDDEEVT
jgi:hypothetical protein